MADSSGLGLANLKTAKTEEDFMAALKQIEVMSVSAGAPADKVKLLEVSKDAKKRCPDGWTKQVQLKYGALLRRIYTKKSGGSASELGLPASQPNLAR